MDSYVEEFQAAGGSMVMLAKGNRSKAVSTGNIDKHFCCFNKIVLVTVCVGQLGCVLPLFYKCEYGYNINLQLTDPVGYQDSCVTCLPQRQY